MDPSLVQLRGKNPLVLVPIANPAHARSMVEIANTLAPSQVARVLLLSIVPPPRGPGGAPLDRLPDAQQVVKEALEASFAAGHAPIAMISAAAPWQEIRRIAVEHDCQSLLLGLGPMAPESDRLETELERLVNDLDCDVAILRAEPAWRLSEARRLMIPVAGRGDEHGLRARVIGSITRDAPREITFVTVCRPDAGEAELAETRRSVTELARRSVPGEPRVEVLKGADPPATLIAAAADHDLIILGLQATGWGRKAIGPVALRIAREAPCASILLSRRRSPLPQAVYRPLRNALNAALQPGAESPDRAPDPAPITRSR
jgi:basic amino acid/polyamine antiporter, APA family